MVLLTGKRLSVLQIHPEVFTGGRRKGGGGLGAGPSEATTLFLCVHAPISLRNSFEMPLDVFIFFSFLY